jgi:hypothetical protein
LLEIRAISGTQHLEIRIASVVSVSVQSKYICGTDHAEVRLVQLDGERSRYRIGLGIPPQLRYKWLLSFPQKKEGKRKWVRPVLVDAHAESLLSPGFSTGVLRRGHVTRGLMYLILEDPSRLSADMAGISSINENLGARPTPNVYTLIRGRPAAPHIFVIICRFNII